MAKIRVGHNSFPVKLQYVCNHARQGGAEFIETEGGHVCHWSLRGVPHLVGLYKGMTFSICWFKNLRKYKVFTPYMSKNQARATCEHPADIIETIERAQRRHIENGN